METDKNIKMLVQIMINTQANALALRDLIMDDMSDRNGNNKKGNEILFKRFTESYEHYQNSITAQLKNHFDLGSIEDLLKGL